MAAFILSLVASVVFGGVLWLTIGPKLKLNEEPVQNEVLNVLAYMGIAFVVLFPLVVVGLSDLFWE